VLQCVAVCCIVLQCVTVCCSMLQCVAVYCSGLQCAAVCSNMNAANTFQSQRLSMHERVGTSFGTATHCNTLQHDATHCNTRQLTATPGNSLQLTATHCNSLQFTATRISYALSGANNRVCMRASMLMCVTLCCSV